MRLTVATGLMMSCTKWPSVDLGKLFNYIIGKKEFDLEYIGKYKDKKAYSYWKSNFVDTVWFAQSKVINICFVKSKVTPSQSVRDEPRDVWIALDETGNILCGWCTNV